MRPAELWHRDQDERRGSPEGAHRGVDKGTVGRRGAVMPSGMHHVAIICKDMEATVKWYEEALGLKLRAVFPMHGIGGRSTASWKWVTVRRSHSYSCLTTRVRVLTQL